LERKVGRDLFTLNSSRLVSLRPPHMAVYSHATEFRILIPKTSFQKNDDASCLAKKIGKLSKTYLLSEISGKISLARWC
jgi:hypothetical protein